MMASASKGTLLALAAALLSGVTVFLNAHAVKAFGDATVYTTAKNVVAALVLLTAGIMVASRQRGAPAPGRSGVWPRSGRELAGLAAIAVVGGCVAFALFFEGLARISSTPLQAQFLNKTLVVWVALLAVLVLRERIGALQAAAVVVLVVGQALLAGGFPALLHIVLGAGELMILAATILWAVEVVLAKALLRSVRPWTVAVWRMVGGSVLLLGWILARGQAGQLLNLNSGQWLWLLTTGLLLAGYVGLWLSALSLAPAVTVTAVLVLAVPVTAALQAATGPVSLGPQLGGLLIVVAGAGLALIQIRRAHPTGTTSSVG